MEWGIPKLTQKGREAIQKMSPEITGRCRNILIQIDGRRTFDDIRTIFKGLDIEDSLHKLVTGDYIEVSHQCRDVIKALAEQMLGPKAPTMIKKLDELHTKYGEACWEHVDEIDKMARLFYGEVVAENLKKEIMRLVREAKKN